MKLTILTFLLLTCVLSFSNPVTHTVTFNTTSNVNCSVGDTLKFYGTFSGDYVVSVNLQTVINPTMVTSPFYLGRHIVTAVDTSFSISEITQGPRSGRITVQLATAIGGHIVKNEFKAFPNPVKNLLTITTIKKSEVFLYTTSGKLLNVFFLEPGTDTIDLSDWQSGLYYLRLDATTLKIIKD